MGFGAGRWGTPISGDSSLNENLGITTGDTSVSGQGTALSNFINSSLNVGTDTSNSTVAPNTPSGSNSVSSYLSSLLGGSGGSSGSTSGGNSLAGLAALGGLGASGLGALLGTNAASKAAGQQVTAGNQIIGNANNTYAQNLATLSPFVNNGVQSSNALATALAPGGSLVTPFSAGMYQQSPAYQFLLQQGEQGLSNQSAASGQYGSGNAQKSAIAYAQNAASTDYASQQSAYQQQQLNEYNYLSGASAQGLSAANSVANSNLSTSQQIAAALGGIGNAQSAGTIGGANALSTGASGAANSALLYALLQGGSGGGGGQSSSNPF